MLQRGSKRPQKDALEITAYHADSPLWQDSLNIVPTGPEMIVILGPRSQSPRNYGVPGPVFQLPRAQRGSKRPPKDARKITAYPRDSPLGAILARYSPNIESRGPEMIVILGPRSQSQPNSGVPGPVFQLPRAQRCSKRPPKKHPEHHSIPSRFVFWSYFGKMAST